MTIALDDPTFEAMQRYAKARGISMNALIRESVRRTIEASDVTGLEETFRLAKELKSKSSGKRWTREEIYSGRRFDWPRSSSTRTS
ncbi:MAG: ribbon-helix-helix protein, CopG family [Armatimonadetes bacterium]|nr:ribbon-helix-helix protein, CopG family [Armatimonadota bacterium]